MRNLDLLIPRADPPPGMCRWATVTGTSPLRIRLDGDSEALPIGVDSLVAGLTAGDRVYVWMTGGRRRRSARRIVVLGRAGGTYIDLSGYLPLSGGTMTGALTLAADPAADLHAATKGYVDNQAQVPIALLTAAAVQSVPNNAYTGLDFANEAVDTDGGHSTSTNPSRYTAPVAGWYQVAGLAVFTANATGARYGRWRVNGTASDDYPTHGYSTAPAGNCYISLPSTLVYMGVDDYVELAVYQNSGGSLNTVYGGGVRSWMSVVYVRGA